MAFYSPPFPFALLFYISCLLKIHHCLLSLCAEVANKRQQQRSKGMQNSIINIPVSININDVEGVINKRAQGLLYEDNDMENNDNDQLMVRLEKDGEIRLRLDGQQIYYTVPLSIWIKKGVLLGAVEAEGSLFLYFRTDFNIQEDWSTQTQTHLERHEWRRKPKAKLGMVGIPVQFVADRILKTGKESLGKAIDQQIQKKLELQKYIEEAWVKIQEPVLLSEDYGMWMKLAPKRISMTPLETHGDLIKSTVSIESGTEVSVGEKPEIEKDLQLPAFQQVPHFDDDFVMNIGVSVPFEEAEKIAREFVIGETFSNGGQEVKIEDLQLSGKEDLLMIFVKLSGSYDGSINLIGKPVFNAESKSIEMENLDFELETRNFIFKSISWLFKKGLVKKIEQGMRFPLGDKIEEVKTLVREKLQDYEIAPHIRLQGNLEGVDIGETTLSEQALSVKIQSHGKVNVRVEGLEI